MREDTDGLVRYLIDVTPFVPQCRSANDRVPTLEKVLARLELRVEYEEILRDYLEGW